MKKLLYIVLLSLPVGVMAQETGSYPGKGAGNSPEGNDVNKVVLEGRNVTESPITPALTCDEAGTVVLTIKVDRNGKVVEAEAGRGTNNMAECLVAYAKSMAMATKFNAKEDAPETETGYMTFRFKKD